ncbi:hypothetical protein [Streptomyces aurantiogriseus]|uniref:Uncharacterized protein n=1 Tax=Streptomyces aurantiogriseus TaxID=66870 RepID=A0A918CI43_9ACTN|nr:hypothetical protein [Streptomyces aurantiogriseus]GGR23998.1 hypothetical protein GCM10010251_45090 [Streptomyces aurantiogriseus]
MSIAKHTWPLHYPGSDKSVLPELLDEAFKAVEEGGVVLLHACEASWHVIHARQAELTPAILRRMAAKVSCWTAAGCSANRWVPALK